MNTSQSSTINIAPNLSTGTTYKAGDPGYYAQDINHLLNKAKIINPATYSTNSLKRMGYWEATLLGTNIIVKNGNWTIRSGSPEPEVLEANLDLWEAFTGDPVDESTYSRIDLTYFDQYIDSLDYIDICVYIMPFNEPSADPGGVTQDPATYLSQWSQNAPTALKFAVGREVDDKDIITTTVEHRRICTVRLVKTLVNAAFIYVPISIVNHVVNNIFMDNGAKFPWQNLNFGYTLGLNDSNDPIVTINSGFVRQHGLRTFSLNETEINLTGSDVVVYIEINRINDSATITSSSTCPDSSSSFINLPLYSFSSGLGATAYTLNRIYHMGDYNFDTPIR